MLQSLEHLVRFGAMGNVGRFIAADATRFPRGRRVILRTQRGLELGEVLTAPDASPAPARQPLIGSDGAAAVEYLASSTGSLARYWPECDGTIIRAATVADELLQARLLKNRDEALAACQSRLDELQLDAVLLDVEHLFDGQTLLFYFLGVVDERVEALTAELAQTYDARAGFSHFVEAATAGCGPGCGTDEGAGCNSCSTQCAVSSLCKTHRH